MGRILVVDDGDLIIEAFRVVMAKFKHEVDYVKSANDAIDLFKTNKYQLVFLDLALPDKDGSEVLKELRAQDNKVKICVISGFLSRLGTFLSQHGHSTENTMFCMKPIGRDEIIKITKEALG